MAGRWSEGFESHTNSSQLLRKYATLTGSIGVSAGRIRGNSGIINSLVAVTPSLGLANTWTLGWAIFVGVHEAQLSTDANGLYLERGTSEQIHVEFESQSSSNKLKVKVKRGTTLLGETGFDFDLNSWHYFELQATLDPTVGAWELKRGGTVLTGATGVNTAASGLAGADIFAFRFADNLTSVRFDDVYLLDSTGGIHDDYLGPQVIDPIVVTANGDTNQWTNDTPGPSSGNFDQVNDPGNAAPDDSGAGGTVSSGTVGQKELYQMSDLVDVSGSVNFVMIGIQAAMATAGSRQLKLKFKDSVAGEADGDTFTVDQTNMDEFEGVLDINPATAAPWTAAEINAGQFGMEVVS